MAILKNLKNDTVIKFKLRKTSEFPNWLGYELILFTRNDNGDMIEFLRLANANTLSLDNLIEPEIPCLLKSLDLLLENDLLNYTFQPTDEKDFCLEIIKENNSYKINCFFDEAFLFNNYIWNKYSKIGIQMIAAKDDVINFIKELKKEYEDISKD